MLMLSARRACEASSAPAGAPPQAQAQARRWARGDEALPAVVNAHAPVRRSPQGFIAGRQVKQGR